MATNSSILAGISPSTVSCPLGLKASDTTKVTAYTHDIGKEIVTNLGASGSCSPLTNLSSVPPVFNDKIEGTTKALPDVYPLNQLAEILIQIRNVSLPVLLDERTTLSALNLLQ